MSQTSLPAYADIARALKKSTKMNASQLHGLMCGFICASTSSTDSRWEALLKKENSSIQNILQSIYEISYRQLNEFSFEFSLLLPDDETTINKRAEALGLWCQGFIIGLEQCQFKVHNRPPSEMTDALNDIIEISEVDYENIDANEDDESAYFELVEYVRLAILMIFHELRPNNPEPLHNKAIH